MLHYSGLHRDVLLRSSSEEREEEEDQRHLE